MSKNYGKLQDQRNSYLSKENFLQSKFSQVSPMDFYRDIFAQGSLQPFGASDDGLGCAIFRFMPDKTTYKKLKERIHGNYVEELYRDSDSAIEYFSRLFDAVPEEWVNELDKRYDMLDKAFNAGVYRKPGKPIETSWKFDQRVHDDLSELGEAIGKRFAIMAPISYYGKKANGKNARYLHAITLDLDGVGIDQLKVLYLGIIHDGFPAPTYLVNSGHGMHLYYVLEEPIPLYNYVKAPITQLKNALIREIWNKKTSTIVGHRDDQPWGQMYRVVGSLSKLGTGYPATAYKTGGYVTLEQLNNFLLEDDRIQLPLDSYRPQGSSGKSLEYWKEASPDWYKRKILKQYDNKTSAGKFPWLYESFKKRVRKYSKVGNRYHCMCVLFADAAQCGVPYSEVYKYVCSQIDFMNLYVDDDKDFFTQDDIDCAAKYYNTDFGYWMTLDRIEGMLDIRIPRNKRNGNNQKTHCAIMRATKDIKIKQGAVKDTRFGVEGGNKSGRSSAEQTVREYLQNNPTAKKVEVIKNTGLSKPTVYKYYDKIKEELSCTSKED